jgi:uncharacterized SAM-binding protein YcdF (DUF218 family)
MSDLLLNTIGFIAVPSSGLLALALIGVLLLSGKHARSGRWLVRISVGLLVTLGLLPIGTALTIPLEERFPPWHSSGADPTGMVVLGGESLWRMIAAAELARRYPAARIVLTGGNSGHLREALPESELMARALQAFGVSAERIELESRSRNTLENATFSKRIVDPKPGELWLLVTSPVHMPRAVGAFRQAGFPVEAYPALSQTITDDEVRLSSSLSAGLTSLDAAVHEWQGLIYYWLTGRSAELFPAPR